MRMKKRDGPRYHLFLKVPPPSLDLIVWPGRRICCGLTPFGFAANAGQAARWDHWRWRGGPQCVSECSLFLGYHHVTCVEGCDDECV